MYCCRWIGVGTGLDATQVLRPGVEVEVEEAGCQAKRLSFTVRMPDACCLKTSNYLPRDWGE